MDYWFVSLFAVAAIKVISECKRSSHVLPLDAVHFNHLAPNCSTSPRKIVRGDIHRHRENVSGTKREWEWNSKRKDKKCTGHFCEHDHIPMKLSNVRNAMKFQTAYRMLLMLFEHISPPAIEQCIGTTTLHTGIYSVWLRFVALHKCIWFQSNCARSQIMDMNIFIMALMICGERESRILLLRWKSTTDAKKNWQKNTRKYDNDEWTKIKPVFFVTEIQYRTCELVLWVCSK